MIYKLQKRLIFISLLSILIVIAIIFCSIAALNVSNMNEMMDTLADTIAKNGGDFPEFQGDKPSSPDGKNPDGSALKAPNIITPETRFSTRFFTVTFDKSGSITEIKTDFISAVSEADAIKYAKSAVNSGRARGWEDDYRYGVYSYGETYRVVFVDGAMNKMMASRAILISGAVLIGAAAVVMLLIILLSRRAIKPIAESYEKQKQFITDANHELKTPLTLILANADIAESELGENEWLSDIRSEGKRMTALVNQLVSLSRMDEQQKLDMSEFSLSGAILDTVSEFEGLAKQKNKNIACMVSDGINEINAAVKAHTGLDANAITRVESDFSGIVKKRVDHDPMEDIMNLPITNID